MEKTKRKPKITNSQKEEISKLFKIGLSMKDISTQLDIPYQTIYKRLMRTEEWKIKSSSVKPLSRGDILLEKWLDETKKKRKRTYFSRRNQNTINGMRTAKIVTLNQNNLIYVIKHNSGLIEYGWYSKKK